MTAKEKLRELADQISEEEAKAAVEYIDKRQAEGSDPMIELLENAPPDDEPTTPEEEAAVREARDEYERGEHFEADEIKRELG